MPKPWEYMSRDEKLDYMKTRLDSIDASLQTLTQTLQGKDGTRGELFEEKEIRGMNKVRGG